MSDNDFNRRAFLLASMQGGLLTLLGGRLFQLQILESHRYRTLASNNQISFRPIIPTRGVIYDAQDLPLALNRQGYRLSLVTSRLRNMQETIERLDGIITLSESQKARLEASFKGEDETFVLADNLTWDDLARLEANHLGLQGLKVDLSSKRIYPFGEECCHVTGYMGEAQKEQEWVHERQRIDSLTGRDGAERAFERQLRGIPGSVEMEVNAYGRVVRDLSRLDPQEGKNIHLTIDQRLQSLGVRRFGSESGAAVMLDCRTGGIKAMVSRPGFDPQILSDGNHPNYWQQLTNDDKAPLVNKTLAGLFAPGSVYKLVVALAALEEGVFNDFETEKCEGFIEAGGRRFHCWREEGHGEISLNQAIAQSCDVFFYRLAERVGVDAIKKMAQKLGLGIIHPLPLEPQKAGFLPTPAWKKKRFNERWHLGDSYVNAIGQGWVSVNALQLAIMTASIAKGSYPFVPSLTPDSAQPPQTKISNYVITPIREGMVGAVNDADGTAYAARIAIEGYEMAGKTGTSQVRQFLSHERLLGSVSNRNMPWHMRDHALFVGYAPIDNPVYAVSVIVQHGGGGSAVAAPIARDLLLWAQKWERQDSKKGKKL